MYFGYQGQDGTTTKRQDVCETWRVSVVLGEQGQTLLCKRWINDRSERGSASNQRKCFYLFKLTLCQAPYLVCLLILFHVLVSCGVRRRVQLLLAASRPLSGSGCCALLSHIQCHCLYKSRQNPQLLKSVAWRHENLIDKRCVTAQLSGHEGGTFFTVFLNKL